MLSGRRLETEGGAGNGSTRRGRIAVEAISRRLLQRSAAVVGKKLMAIDSRFHADREPAFAAISCE